MNRSESYNKLHIILLVSLAGIFVWSAVKPHDYFTWVLEVVPAVVGAVILLAVYNVLS